VDRNNWQIKQTIHRNSLPSVRTKRPLENGAAAAACPSHAAALSHQVHEFQKSNRAAVQKSEF
jgi:hypothetical protein